MAACRSVRERTWRNRHVDVFRVTVVLVPVYKNEGQIRALNIIKKKPLSQ